MGLLYEVCGLIITNLLVARDTNTAIAVNNGRI